MKDIKENFTIILHQIYLDSLANCFYNFYCSEFWIQFSRASDVTYQET